MKSLMEFICESIDEALPPGSTVTGRELYLRGFDRHLEEHFRLERKRRRREIEAAIPLLAQPESDAIEDFAE